MRSSVAPRACTNRSASFAGPLSRGQCETAFALRVIRVARSTDWRKLGPILCSSALRALLSRFVSEGRGVMRGLVIVCRDQFKILGSVVRPVAVAMMNLLSPTKATTEDRAHDHSVFEVVSPNAITLDPNFTITVRTDVSGHERILANRLVYARSGP